MHKFYLLHKFFLCILYNIPTWKANKLVLEYVYKEKKPIGDSRMAAKKLKTQNADNVKARVLHVMNVNHTEKRLSTCSKNA